MTFQVESGANFTTQRLHLISRSILTRMSQYLCGKSRHKKAWMLQHSSMTGSGKIWPSLRPSYRHNVAACRLHRGKDKPAKPWRRYPLRHTAPNQALEPTPNSLVSLGGDVGASPSPSTRT